MLTLGLALQIAATAGAARPAGGIVAPPPASRAQQVVVVDAGHGGPDNGMSGPIGRGPKVVEKNVTLAVAMRLGEALRQRGVTVVYTRTTDTLIALTDRGRIANEATKAAKGKLFISVHVNAANPNWKNPGGARGVETYFLSDAKTEDERRVAAIENESEKYDPAVENGDPLSFIMSDMLQNEYLRESSTFAERVQRSLAGVHPGTDRGVKQAGFRVLVTAFMPAILVEIGFGTNPDEAKFITDAAQQRVIANAIADAAVKYLDDLGRRTGTSASKK